MNFLFGEKASDEGLGKPVSTPIGVKLPSVPTSKLWIPFPRSVYAPTYAITRPVAALVTTGVAAANADIPFKMPRLDRAIPGIRLPFMLPPVEMRQIYR
jgi:hypothetical protein